MLLLFLFLFLLIIHLSIYPIFSKALGVGSALEYVPGAFASTAELIALSQAAAEYDGMYISHIRSEADRLLEAVDEFVNITTSAKVRGQIYHLKAAGERNWPKLQTVIDTIDGLRAEGKEITACMYTYTAASTALDACIPPWAQVSGLKVYY